MTAVDVVVLGGGAAGLMCAQVAGRRGRRVVVLERSERVGKKILMSGGGRCNFTHLHTSPERFLSANPHFAKSALARYTPADFVALVEKHGIAYHEKEAGQLFCDVSSKLIVRLLLDECRDAAVRVEVGCRVDRVEKTGDGFVVHGSKGAFRASSLVVATGGLSIPSMGATGFGYELARQFGLRVLPTRAGLVPLTLGEPDLSYFRPLSGVAVAIAASRDGVRFAGPMLFTHRGLSGPAILQISSYWQPGDDLAIDLLPGRDARAWLEKRRRARPAAELRTVLADVLPRRLAQALCDRDLESRPLRQISDRDLAAIAARLARWPFRLAGTEGYRTAEVTLGGVDTAALSSTTMEVRTVPGLYFIGEVVDVTGHLGGFNFQWAWASGHAAGEVV